MLTTATATAAVTSRLSASARVVDGSSGPGKDGKKGGDEADRGSQGEAYKAVFGNTDKLIETKDALAEKAMLVGVFVAFHLLLWIQKLTGLGPVFAAMPVFVFLIAVEFVIQRVSKFHSKGASYTVAGLICSVSAGVIQQISKVLMEKACLMLGLYPYEKVYENYGFQLGGDVTQAALALVFQDLGYYWAHRCYHQVQVGWMFHAIHHNNDHYNFAGEGHPHYFCHQELKVFY